MGAPRKIDLADPDFEPTDEELVELSKRACSNSSESWTRGSEVKPALLIIAGPNGSGKTTVTVRLREDHWSDGVEYLNPDDIGGLHSACT